MTDAPPSVVCFGEILWDILPDGRHPGGAPFNVAYHLHRQGCAVEIISAVGRDALGDELLQRLDSWGISSSGIVRHPQLPTGTVRATLSANGDARYEIANNVAWDRIEFDEHALRAIRTAKAGIFGSLAQRSTFNRDSLEHLLSLLPTDALRVFDVNLRAPFDDLALVGEIAKSASLLKLNAQEAARLAAGENENPGREEADARHLAQETGCPQICITAGARGAGFLVADRWHWEPGLPVKVADTVGAGDAFLAGLVASLLKNRSDQAGALGFACRLGEWVASQHGATPTYPA